MPSASSKYNSSICLLSEQYHLLVSIIYCRPRFVRRVPQSRLVVDSDCWANPISTRSSISSRYRDTALTRQWPSARKWKMISIILDQYANWQQGNMMAHNRTAATGHTLINTDVDLARCERIHNILTQNRYLLVRPVGGPTRKHLHSCGRVTYIKNLSGCSYVQAASDGERFRVNWQDLIDWAVTLNSSYAVVVVVGHVVMAALGLVYVNWFVKPVLW